MTAIARGERGLVNLTEAATTKLKEIIAAKNRPDLALRIFVKSGGCSGFSYGMALDGERDHDHTAEVDGIKIVIDPMSARYLEGAEVDYRDALMGGGFTIENPNATMTCGCGQSFRTANERGTPKRCC